MYGYTATPRAALNKIEGNKYKNQFMLPHIGFLHPSIQH